MKYLATALGATLLASVAVGGASAQSQQAATAQNYWDLDDTEVVSADGTRVGEIDEVVIGRDGQLAYILEIEEGFLGLRDEEVVVPLDRVTFDAQNKRFTTDLAEADFQKLEAWQD